MYKLVRSINYIVTMLTVLVLAACQPKVAPTAIPTATITPTPEPQTIEYSIDTSKSTIDYLATGAFNIQFPGTFSIESGSLAFVPEVGQGSQPGTARIKVDVVIDGNSVTAVNDLVKNALRNNLEVDKYPKGRFTATSKEIVTIGKFPLQFTAMGTLELHVRQKNVEMPFTLSGDNTTVKANGEMSLDLLDYEVHVPTAIMNSKVTFKTNVTATNGSSNTGNSNTEGSAMAAPTAPTESVTATVQ